MRNKDKKIVDRYMKKHPNATPEKIQKYAESKGIYVDVMTEIEHDKIKKQIQEIVGIDNVDDSTKFNEILENLTEEQRQQLINLKRDSEDKE